MKYQYVLFALVFVVFLSACRDKPDPTIHIQTDETFSDYWYSGLAEITTYKLEQGQYGTTFPGVVTTIFVTEDFDVDKHVKPDLVEVEGQVTVPVLKLNKMKHFQTGIYPYHKMLSTFTPIVEGDAGRAIKITAGAMEWCGQNFSQWNLRDDRWQLHSFSYFERQGDLHTSFDRVWQEDEIWSLIRLAPDHLPRDTFNIIAGNLNLRDRVAKPEVHSAYANLRQLDGATRSYELYIPDINRRLRIAFESDFPYRILSWEEEFFSRQEKVIHKATRYKTKRVDYWTKNQPGDRYLFQELMPAEIVSLPDSLIYPID